MQVTRIVSRLNSDGLYDERNFIMRAGTKREIDDYLEGLHRQFGSLGLKVTEVALTDEGEAIVRVGYPPQLKALRGQMVEGQ